MDNGIAFQTPKRWELSVNELVKGVSRIVLEDDFGPRLELDWTTPRSPSETERFRKRSLEYIKIIDEKSRSVTPLAASQVILLEVTRTIAMGIL